MRENCILPEDVAALAVLANGMIPSDHRDGGAASVEAGPRIAERIRNGANGSLYAQGLNLAAELSQARFASELLNLSPLEVAELLGLIREQLPLFFRQLRADTCAIYMSDPAVWRRIGFPGPSASSGGYPKFDQTQAGS